LPADGFMQKNLHSIHQKLSNFENLIYTVNFVRATFAKSVNCLPNILRQKRVFILFSRKKTHAHVDEIDPLSQFHQPSIAKYSIQQKIRSSISTTFFANEICPKCKVKFAKKIAIRQKKPGKYVGEIDPW